MSEETKDFSLVLFKEQTLKDELIFGTSRLEPLVVKN